MQTDRNTVRDIAFVSANCLPPGRASAFRTPARFPRACGSIPLGWSRGLTPASGPGPGASGLIRTTDKSRKGKHVRGTRGRTGEAARQPYAVTLQTGPAPPTGRALAFLPVVLTCTHKESNQRNSPPPPAGTTRPRRGTPRCRGVRSHNSRTGCVSPLPSLYIPVRHATPAPALTTEYSPFHPPHSSAFNPSAVPASLLSGGYCMQRAPHRNPGLAEPAAWSSH